MDRYFGLFLIVALLFPSGLPRAGEVCAALDPEQPSCCCPEEQNLAANEFAPRVQAPCCCDVRAPEPGKKPAPALVVSADKEWSAAPLVALTSTNLLLPPAPALWAEYAAAPRGPPGDLYRRHCVIRC